MRLDQWLWSVRVFKTRSLAAIAIKSGHVTVNELPAKAAREMRPGDLIVAKVHELTRTLRVIAAPPSRVGAKLVPQFAEDLTPPEEFEKQREAARSVFPSRPAGTGRPTKKERREIDELEL